MKNFIQDTLAQGMDTLSRFLQDPSSLEQIESATNALVDCFQRQGKALSCGNGGSMCDAIHFAEELSGRYRQDRPPLPAMAVSDPGYISCVANDYGYENIFSRAVEAWLKKGDILVAISTSGRSKNIVRAVKTARSQNIATIALLGNDGGVLKESVDIPIIVPSPLTERIQEIHIKIIHILIEGIERKLFPEHYSKNRLNKF